MFLTATIMIKGYPPNSTPLIQVVLCRPLQLDRGFNWHFGSMICFFTQSVSWWSCCMPVLEDSTASLSSSIFDVLTLYWSAVTCPIFTAFCPWKWLLTRATFSWAHTWFCRWLQGAPKRSVSILCSIRARSCENDWLADCPMPVGYEFMKTNYVEVPSFFPA